MTGRSDPGPDGLFVYGTLLFPAVLDALLQRVPERRAARAPGWRVAALAGRPYPGLVPDPGAVAPGAVITGLSPTDWTVIDAFEGPGYVRRRIATTPFGDALAYVLTVGMEPLAADWDPERFRRAALDDFVAGCAAWRAGLDGDR